MISFFLFFFFGLMTPTHLCRNGALYACFSKVSDDHKRTTPKNFSYHCVCLHAARVILLLCFSLPYSWIFKKEPPLSTKLSVYVNNRLQSSPCKTRQALAVSSTLSSSKHKKQRLCIVAWLIE